MEKNYTVYVVKVKAEIVVVVQDGGGGGGGARGGGVSNSSSSTVSTEGSLRVGEWTLLRRYSQFAALRDEVAAQAKAAQAQGNPTLVKILAGIPFPPKTMNKFLSSVIAR